MCTVCTVCTDLHQSLGSLNAADKEFLVASYTKWPTLAHKLEIPGILSSDPKTAVAWKDEYSNSNPPVPLTQEEWVSFIQQLNEAADFVPRCLLVAIVILQCCMHHQNLRTKK